jgi:phenylpropionate dioxygenase-like ring-hydroxylating dioxygenase large terminal subunit
LRQTTDAIIEALAENSSGSFDDALSLPPGIYHDSRILEREIEEMFRKDWVCIGRLAEVPEVGDFICRDIIDSRLFVVRQKDATVKAFANSCAHRAASMLEGEGRVTRISCPYHSWTYDLDGQLVGAPFMEGTKGFNVRNHRLKELAVVTWEGFIYVSLNENPASLSGQLEDLSALVGNYRMANYVPVISESETWQTNWKCLAENFMDSYHLHRVHKNTFRRYGSYEDITHLFPGTDAFSYSYIQETEERNTVRAHADNTWLKGDDRYRTFVINIYPCHLIQLQPDLLWYLSILPEGTDRVSIRWAVSIPAEILDSADDRQHYIDEEVGFLQAVNSEDRGIVENVARATRSPEATRGPLSCLERNVWDFARYLARRLCT